MKDDYCVEDNLSVLCSQSICCKDHDKDPLEEQQSEVDHTPEVNQPEAGAVNLSHTDRTSCKIFPSFHPLTPSSNSWMRVLCWTREMNIQTTHLD